VPAVIAKASAIYNPIIYAIIHPRYRYSKHIGMCTTLQEKVFLKMNEQELLFSMSLDFPALPSEHIFHKAG